MHDDRTRYSRHLALAEFDTKAQARLAGSRVFLIGLGGLGCPIATYLTAAGVGMLSINDFDTIDISNLQRQILFRESDVGRHKVAAATDALRGLNSTVNIVPVDRRLQNRELDEAVAGVDLVIDASDNFGTRFEVNRACREAGVPLLSAACIRFSGQLILMDLREAASPCLLCLFPDSGDEVEDCRGQGIFGPVAGVVGCAAAGQAIAMLTGLPGANPGQLRRYDGIAGIWSDSIVRQDPACQACVSRRTP